MSGSACKHLAQRRLIGAVDAVSRHVSAQNGLDARQGRLLRVAEIVDNNWLIAGLLQLHHRVGADVAGAAGNENFHVIS